MSLDLLADLDDLDGGSDEEAIEETPAAANGLKRTREEMEEQEEGAPGDDDEDMSDEEDEAVKRENLEQQLAAKLKGADDVKAVAKLLNSKGFQETLKVSWF